MSTEPPRLVVATRHGVDRPATQQEVCRHWMVRRRHWSGGKQVRRCAYCGHVDWVDVSGVHSSHRVSQVEGAQLGHPVAPIRDSGGQS